MNTFKFNCKKDPDDWCNVEIDDGIVEFQAYSDGEPIAGVALGADQVANLISALKTRNEDHFECETEPEDWLDLNPTDDGVEFYFGSEDMEIAAIVAGRVQVQGLILFLSNN